MTSGTPLLESGLPYLLTASQATGHNYWLEPNEARLAVFACTLENMEQAIRKALRSRTITETFKEQDLVPELDYIIETVDKFRDARSVTITGGEQTLGHISNLLYKAIITLNSAAYLDQDTTRQRDKFYWDDYQDCYLDCANKLRDARTQIGRVGFDLLPRPPP